MNKLLYVILVISLVIGRSVAYAQEDVVPVVSKIEWSSDGSHILITQREGGLFLVDAITQSIVAEIPGDLTGPIEDAALQPGGLRVATVDRFTGLKIWDLDTLGMIYSDNPVLAWQVDWSLNGQWLVTGNMETMFIRDPDGGSLFNVSYASEDIPRVAFSSDSRLLALSFTYALEIYDLTLQQSIAYNVVPGFRHSIQWSMNGDTILTAITDMQREGKFFRTVIINPITGERVREYSGFPNQLTFARWSPDETEILATSVDGTAYLIDADSGAITPIFTGDVPLLSADWSPYGGQVAIGAPAHLETGQALSGTGANIAGVPVQIFVPDPSLDRLNAIAELCVRDAATQSRAVTGLTSQRVDSLDALPDFVAQVESLPEGAIQPACRADLLAVAEALR